MNSCVALPGRKKFTCSITESILPSLIISCISIRSREWQRGWMAPFLPGFFINQTFARKRLAVDFLSQRRSEGRDGQSRTSAPSTPLSFPWLDVGDWSVVLYVLFQVMIPMIRLLHKHQAGLHFVQRINQQGVDKIGLAGLGTLQ
jgi:hypothetical protein